MMVGCHDWAEHRTSIRASSGVRQRTFIGSMYRRQEAHLARYVTMLLAVPPGQHDTRTRPTAKELGRKGRREMRSPRVGIT